jgi:hypothetical protein
MDGPTPTEEAYARFIDPQAWADWDAGRYRKQIDGSLADLAAYAPVFPSLTKARAILALQPSPRGEVVGHEPRGCPTPGACSCPSPMSPNKRASIICDFMGWTEDGVAWADAHKLAASLSAAAPPSLSGCEELVKAAREFLHRVTIVEPKIDNVILLGAARGMTWNPADNWEQEVHALRTALISFKGEV